MRFFISLSLIGLLFQSTMGFADSEDSRFQSFVYKALTTCASFFSETKKIVSNSGAELTLFKFGRVHIFGSPYYGGFIPYMYLGQIHDIKDVDKLDGDQGFILHRDDGTSFTLGTASTYYQEELKRIEGLLEFYNKEDKTEFYKALTNMLDYYPESDESVKDSTSIYKQLFYETSTLTNNPNATMYEIKSKGSIQTHRILKGRLEGIRKIYKALTETDFTKESFNQSFINSSDTDIDISSDDIYTAIRIYKLEVEYLDQFLFKAFDLALSAPTSTSVTEDKDQQPAISSSIDTDTTKISQPPVIDRKAGFPTRDGGHFLNPAEREKLFNRYQTTPAQPFYGSWRNNEDINDDTSTSVTEDTNGPEYKIMVDTDLE